jgi:hypothetical protein
MKHSNATTLLLLLSLTACASQRVNPLLSQAADSALSKKDFLKKSHEADELWGNRNQQDSLLRFIELEEELSRSEFQTREHIVQLAHAHFILAEYMLDINRDKDAHWNQGANWAEKALTFNPAFKKKVVDEKVPTEQALSTLTAKDVEALYWYAGNLGRWASMQGLTQVLKYKERVKKMIDRVAELNSGFFYGAVYRYYGVYYALLPGYTDEDLKNSKRNFETALKKYPEYFSNHVLYAQAYASKIEDESLYKKHLNFVVKGNPKNFSYKEAYPEQLMEQARAKRLLERSQK